MEREGDHVTVHGSEPLLAAVAVALDRQGINPPDLETERATLDDVFLALTGREARERGR